MKPAILRWHRRLALVFALPLAALMLSGLILSAEPAAQLASRTPGALSAETILAALARHDPEGRADRLAYRAGENALEIGGPRFGAPLLIDLATLEPRREAGAAARVFALARRLHLTLLLDLSALVLASTAVLAVLLLLGVAMGWRRLSNTMPGWHRGLGWLGLPLLLAVPVTGLLMSFNITFVPQGGPMPAAMAPAPMSLAQAVERAGRQHDLGEMVWIRRMGPRHMLRSGAGERFQGHVLTPAGFIPVPRNWPRSLHEGLWGGYAGSVVNMLLSVAMIALAVTGLTLWLRRRQARRRASGVRAAAGEAPGR